MNTALQGSSNYHQGFAAEDMIAQRYTNDGAIVLENRWRGKAGEVDLICRADDTLVFVEVKSSKHLANAAHALTARQIHRLQRAAEEYLSFTGMTLDTNIRFDVALVAPFGNVAIIQNALGY